MADKIDGPVLVFDWGQFLTFLFGGGPAGSGGQFRDAYYEVIGKLTPAWTTAAGLWARTGLPGEYWPTQIMTQYGTTFGTVQESLDDGFNQFQGSNLLGQTMLSSRLQLFVLRKWLEQALFGTAQFAQIRIGALEAHAGDATTAIAQLWNAIGQIQGQIGGGGAGGGTLAALQTQVNNIQNYVTYLQSTLIPQLVQADITFNATLNNAILPRILSLEQTRTDIQNVLSTQLWPNINALSQRVTFLEQHQPPDLSQWITSVNTQLASLSGVINGEIKARLTNNEQWIQALVNFNNTYTIPAITIQVGQITAIQQDIANNINPRLQLALTKIQRINQNKIPRIKQKIRTINEQLGQLGQIPDIVQQITTLLEHVTELETQKTETVLPQLAELATAVAEIAGDIQNRINPRDAVQDQNITNIQTWIVNVGGPTIELHTQQITNITDVLNNFVTVNLSYLITFINNFNTQVTNVIQANCQLVYDCLAKHRENNPGSACEEGRTWWGKWAECWLSTHTDDTDVAGEGLAYVVDIPSLRAVVQGAAQKQSTGRWADKVALCREVVAFGLGDALPRGGLPGAEGIEGAPFVFEEAA